MPHNQVEVYESFGASHCLLLLFQRKLVPPSSVCKIFWIIIMPWNISDVVLERMDRISPTKRTKNEYVESRKKETCYIQ
jgi:hypothetical protein